MFSTLCQTRLHTKHLRSAHDSCITNSEPQNPPDSCCSYLPRMHACFPPDFLTGGMSSSIRAFFADGGGSPTNCTAVSIQACRQAVHVKPSRPAKVRGAWWVLQKERERESELNGYLAKRDNANGGWLTPYHRPVQRKHNLW